jgi:nucleoside-diphosphate-sugar epimerase
MALKLQTSIPLGSWVLVTGANGLLGTHLVLQFLQRGYRVRGTVRDPIKSSWLVDRVFKEQVAVGSFELFTLADLGSEAGCAAAVQGVSAVVANAHGCSSFHPDPNLAVTPVANDMRVLLEAMKREPTVKSFVYTSSLAACIIAMPGDATHINQDTWNEAAVQMAWAPPPYEPARGFLSYSAAKVTAERIMFKFAEEEKPAFRVNAILPASVWGEFFDASHGGHSYSKVQVAWDGQAAEAGFGASKSMLSNQPLGPLTEGDHERRLTRVPHSNPQRCQRHCAAPCDCYAGSGG